MPYIKLPMTVTFFKLRSESFFMSRLKLDHIVRKSDFTFGSVHCIGSQAIDALKFTV